MSFRRLRPMALMFFGLIFVLKAEAQNSHDSAFDSHFDVQAAIEILSTSTSKSQAIESLQALLKTSVFPELPPPKDLYAKIGSRSEPEEFWNKLSSYKIEKKDSQFLISGQKIQAHSMSALWALIPHLAFGESRGFLTMETCRKVAPLLALMTSIGVRLEPKEYPQWNFTKNDFVQWMELFITLGNRLEMLGGGDLAETPTPNFESGIGTCDASLSYIKTLMPQLSGLPWLSRDVGGRQVRVIRMAMSEPETFSVSAIDAPGYSAQFRFLRIFGPHWELRRAQFLRFNR